MPEVTLHDGTAIEVTVHGSGPTVLLPTNPRPPAGSDRVAADNPLVDGLRDAFRVVAFDYEGHLLRHPRPDTLTPGNITGDLLAIADLVKADRFAYHGYSWLAMSGLQLAIRTHRLSALALGGFCPLDGPYARALRGAVSVHETVASRRGDGSLTEPQARQFVTLYESLQGFAERAIQTQVTSPRLCFVGGTDETPSGRPYDGISVDAGTLVRERQPELRALGWDVRILDGLDRTGAGEPEQVLGVLRPWLTAALGGH
jgi:hypothetical protein